MASVDLTDPQTLNLYTYARNNPIDFTDPTGLMPVGPGYCIRYHYTNLSGTIQFWGPWTCYGGSGGGYDEPDSFGFGGGGSPPPEPKQDEKKCNVKNVGNMSEALQNMIGGFGIKNAEFDKLGNDAKLGFLNVLGAMADAKGVSLEGWIVDRKDGQLRIDQERTFFIPSPQSPGVYGALETAVSKSNFNPQYRGKHKDVKTAYRQKPSHRSLQIGFGVRRGFENPLLKQKFMEVDIDLHNPHRLPLEHFFADVVRNKVAGAFGGVGKTDPYHVANRKYWECKPQK